MVDIMGKKTQLKVSGKTSKDGVSSETTLFEEQIRGTNGNIYLNNGGSNSADYTLYFSRDGSTWFQKTQKSVSSGSKDIIEITSNPSYMKLTVNASTSTDSLSAELDLNVV